MSACPTCGQTVLAHRPRYRMQKLNDRYGWQLHGNSDRFMFTFEHDHDGFDAKWSITVNTLVDRVVMNDRRAIGGQFFTRREAVQFALQWEVEQ